MAEETMERKTSGAQTAPETDFIATGTFHASSSADGETFTVKVETSAGMVSLRVPLAMAANFVLAAATAAGMASDRRRKMLGGQNNVLGFSAPVVITVPNFGLGVAGKHDGTADVLFELDIGNGAQMHFAFSPEKTEELLQLLPQVLADATKYSPKTH